MHEIKYLSYHCSTTEKQILKDLDRFAYDPHETLGYHGQLTFHRDIICKNYNEAMAKLENICRYPYDDHAIFYKEGRKKFWLVKCEWHC